MSLLAYHCSTGDWFADLHLRLFHVFVSLCTDIFILRNGSSDKILEAVVSAAILPSDSMCISSPHSLVHFLGTSADSRR